MALASRHLQDHVDKLSFGLHRYSMLRDKARPKAVEINWSAVNSQSVGQIKTQLRENITKHLARTLVNKLTNELVQKWQKEHVAVVSMNWLLRGAFGLHTRPIRLLRVLFLLRHAATRLNGQLGVRWLLSTGQTSSIDAAQKVGSQGTS